MIQEPRAPELRESEASYLNAFIAPLRPYLDRSDVTDIFINGDTRVWAESVTGTVRCIDVPALDEAWLWQLARQIARKSHQGINRESPILSAVLPDGTRIQMIAPPATRQGIAVAFRRQVTMTMRLGDYTAAGAMPSAGTDDAHASDAALSAAYDAHDYERFLRLAVRQRKTILIAGGTATGKTTFANALLHEIPLHERLILIEDTPELLPPQPNVVGLVAVRSALGETGVSTDHLLQAVLRMRPDRIILGELRGDEAFTFLRAVSTGHPGAISTIHADSAAHAVDQLALLVLQAGSRLEWQDVRRYVDKVIDIHVQLRRTPAGRRIDRIVWNRRSG